MAVGTAMLDLQQAIYTMLGHDAALATMISGVFDEVPEDQPFPYITLSTMTELVNDVFPLMGRELTIDIHVWSQYPGFEENKSIIDRLNQLLNRRVLPGLTTFATVMAYYEHGINMRETDGITRRSIARYGYLLEALT